MKFRVAALVCLCLVGGLASAQAPPIGVARYEIVAIIDHPDSIYLSAMHLNNKGEVAGRYSTSPECDVPEVSFVWSNGEFRYVSFPGVFSTRGESVNERGFVTGSIVLEKPVRDPVTGKCAPYFRHGFVMTPDGGFHRLPWVEVHSVVNNITPSGWMTGPTTPCTPGEEGCVYYGFLYNGRDEPLFFLPTGCDSTDAMDVNNRGAVVGTCHPVGSNKQAGTGFRLRDGACELIAYPGAMNTVFSGTNSAGDIVGRAWFAGQPQAVHFIYQRHQFAVIEIVGADGPVAASVWDINDTGMISGHTRTADGREVGFLARPVR
jgi:hypothetical protein